MLFSIFVFFLMIRRPPRSTLTDTPFPNPTLFRSGQRIVVLHKGRIQQIDTPMALYEKPANLFVATFLGSPKMNLLDGELRAGDEGLRLRVGDDVELPLSPGEDTRDALKDRKSTRLNSSH